jgi:hypothetical protein
MGGSGQGQREAESYRGADDSDHEADADLPESERRLGGRLAAPDPVLPGLIRLGIRLSGRFIAHALIWSDDRL